MGLFWWTISACLVVSVAGEGVLLNEFFSSKCRLDQTCSRHANRVTYKPYNFDAKGVRIQDGLTFPRSQTLHLHFKRAARVTICFHRLAHLAATNLCTALPKLCGSKWVVDTNFPDARLRPNGRYRRAGLRNGGLTLFQDVQAGEWLSLSPQAQRFSVWLEEVEGGETYYTALPPTPPSEVPPVANQKCPDWVLEEDRAKVVDYRDGRTYDTWHPQWHPVYWCSYGHEHGSDPRLIGPVRYPDGVTRDSLQVSLGFVAYYNSRQNEPNLGFKGYVIKGLNVDVYLNIHTTSSSIGRVCARFHTLIVMGVSKAGDLLYELGYKADFGAARSRHTHGFLSPTNCPEQDKVFPICQRRQCNFRKLRVAPENRGYEKWDGGDNSINTANAPLANVTNPGQFLPLKITHFGIDIRNPITGCVDDKCDELYFTNHDGTKRTLSFRSLRVQYNEKYDSNGDGYFVTDRYGYFLRDLDMAKCRSGTGYCQLKPDGDLIQYVRPGTDSVLEGDRRYGSNDPWSMEYRPRADTPSITHTQISNALKLGASPDCSCFRDVVPLEEEEGATITVPGFPFPLPSALAAAEPSCTCYRN